MKIKNLTLSSLSTLLIPLSIQARPLEPYNAEAAVNYARKWVQNGGVPLRNTAYPDLSNPNGDCTNFVSQALTAGGWRNTLTTNVTSDLLWWYKSKASYSQSWSVAHAFFRHLNGGVNPPTTGKSYESWYKFGGLSSANYGDIVQADWAGNNAVISHTMIVTGFKRRGDGIIEPRLSYHSNDTKDIPLTDFMIRVKASYPKAKFYTFSPLAQCTVPNSKYIF